MTCFVAGITACNKDLGHYNYTEINTVKIDAVNNVTAAVGSTLEIVPTLTFSLGEDESIFSFTWYVKQDTGWVALQQSRNLEIEVSGLIGTPTEANPYSMAYEVINNKTQVAYRKLFSLTVINPLTRGYTALCEHDNDFDIDMLVLSPENNFSLYKNILNLTGSAIPRENVKPYDIMACNDNMAPDPYNRDGVTYSVYILTDQYTTHIKALDYSWQPSYDISNTVERNSYLDKEFVQQGKKIIAQQMKYAYMVTGSLLYNRIFLYNKEDNGQGNWYVCSNYPAWYFYSQPMNDVRPSGNARYEPAPFISGNSNGAMYFNADTKSFMYQVFPSASGLGTTDLFYTQPLINEPDGASFNFSDSNNGLLYMDERLGNSLSSDAGYAILKEADGSFNYIEFGYSSSIAGMVANTNKKRACIFPAGSSIGNAKFFASDPRVNSPFLFYATNDNKVYRADISSATASVVDITSSILAGDGYSEITVFKFTLPNTSSIGGGLERALAVGTYNSSLGKAEGGKLDFFTMADATTGVLALAKYPSDAPDGQGQTMSWKGLGRIVGLTYKEK